jgi:3',5'-cyclic AMP phosphodiesterase CpdA
MSDPAAEPVVRLAHFSDVHVSSQQLGWRGGDLLTKRVTGWFNLRFLGRGFRFRRAAAVAATLMRDLRQRPFDMLVFSGDATALAFESEFVEAAKALGVGEPDVPPGIAVPGNHDCYVRSAVVQHHFERYFAPWQTGVRLDNETYPFARQAGPVWLVGVNSATFNFWTWDASGRVGAAQRDRLRRLLAELPPGPRILVTHYPVALADGTPEKRWRRLRDWREVVKVAADGGVCLWLHGHRHRPYHLDHRSPAAPFPVICGGSATQSNLWTYHEYDVVGRSLKAVRRSFDSADGQFRDLETFEIELTNC